MFVLYRLFHDQWNAYNTGYDEIAKGDSKEDLEALVKSHWDYVILPESTEIEEYLCL